MASLVRSAVENRSCTVGQRKRTCRTFICVVLQAELSLLQDTVVENMLCIHSELTGHIYMWSEHVVLATPVWWGGLPAKLKGLVDRAFLPGRTFDTRNTTTLGLPGPMLSGRTGRVLMLSDTPNWVFRLLYRNALMVQLRGQILGFVGIRPLKITQFSGTSHPERKAIGKWLKKAAALNHRSHKLVRHRSCDI